MCHSCPFPPSIWELFWRKVFLAFISFKFFLATMQQFTFFIHFFFLMCFNIFRCYFFIYVFAAQNNCNTRHLAKILIHLTQCLQESISSSGSQSTTYMKAINAVYISSVFLKYLIENAQSDKFDELHLSLAESEPIPKEFIIGI